MTLNDIFAHIFSETWWIWTKLVYKIFGGITSAAAKKGVNTNIFVSTTAHRFGPFRFIDFHET